MTSTSLAFSSLVGKTLTHVINEGDKIVFIVSPTETYKLEHWQDCCEYVSVESIVGDLSDLIGAPLLKAEEVSGETPADYKFEFEPASYTWTFYKLATIKGYVDIRWLGTSNGDYSEAVNFCRGN